MVFMENSFFKVGRVRKNRLAPPTNKNASGPRLIPLHERTDEWSVPGSNR